MQKLALKRRKVTLKDTWPYHLLILPGLLVVLIYTIIPFLGNVIAFQDFKPIMGFQRSEWVGLENFRYMFSLKDTAKIFRNSLFIASMKLLLSLIASIFFAIVLHEAMGQKVKKCVQTICFLPHFLSWVILATIFKNIFDDTGLVNTVLVKLGLASQSVNFLGSNRWFPALLQSTWVTFP